jgi:hypothetical protein
MITLVRVGDRLFSLGAVQEVDLAYQPRRHNAARPPSEEVGVQVVLMSGHQLPPLWDSAAGALRDFLTGRPVGAHCDVIAPGVQVVTLTETVAAPEAPPAAEPEVHSITWGEISAPVLGPMA